jgi:hypothetical protein
VADGCSGRQGGALGNGERRYEVGEQGLLADEFDSAGGESRVRVEKAGEDVEKLSIARNARAYT